MISNRCARKSLVTNCNSIISKNYSRFLVDSNDTKHKNAKESKQKQKSPYGKSHSPITNSLFHTVGYKNHSVGYIFHSVRYKSRTVKQRI